MAYALLANGGTYTISSSLGNLLSQQTLQLTDDAFKWPQAQTGTWYSQSESGDREFHLFCNNGNFVTYLGHELNILGTYEEVFGSQDLDGVLDVFIDFVNKTLTLSVGGVTYLDSVSVLIGTSRVNNARFRQGARGDSSGEASSSGGTHIAPAGARFGNLTIREDGVITRTLVAPTSGNVWPETTNNQDATVYGTPTWQNLDGGASLTITNCPNNRQFGLDELGGSTVEFVIDISDVITGLERSTDGGDTWEFVASSPSSPYTDTVSLTTGQYEVLYRVEEDTAAQTQTVITGVGPIFVLAGHSNVVAQGENNQTLVPSTTGTIAFNLANDGTIKTAQDPIDDATGQLYSVSQDDYAKGSWAILFANKWLADNPNTPIMFIPCSKGGSRTPDWYQSTSTSTLYGAMAAQINRAGGVTAFLFGIGSSDSAESTSYDEMITRYETLFNAIQSDYAAPVYLMSVQNYAYRDAGDVLAVRQATQDFAHSRNDIISWPSTYGVDLTNSDGIHFTSDAQILTLADGCYNAYTKGDNSCLISVPSAEDGEYTLTLSDGSEQILNEPILLRSGEAATAGFYQSAGTSVSGQITDGVNTYLVEGVIGGTLSEEAIAQPPTANAGTSQTVAAGVKVTLNGVGSTVGVSYNWYQVSGFPVNLKNSNTATPSFTSPISSEAGDVVIGLVVTLEGLDSPVDTVTISYEAFAGTTKVPNALSSNINAKLIK
jgi:hypothetical protein